jgi:hypothetical protein
MPAVRERWIGRTSTGADGGPVRIGRTHLTSGVAS